MTRSEATALQGVAGLPDSIRRKVERLTATRARGVEKPGVTGKAEKRAKRTTRGEQRSALRAQAMERDAGACVVCGAPATELHHLIGRHREALEVLAILCLGCHRLVHSGQTWELRRLAAWAVRNGYAEAARAVAKRLGHIEDTRGSRAARVEGRGR